MSLPPVVSDVEVCWEAPYERWSLPDPHFWEDFEGQVFAICRFCGGRKP